MQTLNSYLKTLEYIDTPTDDTELCEAFEVGYDSGFELGEVTDDASTAVYRSRELSEIRALDNGAVLAADHNQWFVVRYIDEETGPWAVDVTEYFERVGEE